MALTVPLNEMKYSLPHDPHRSQDILQSILSIFSLNKAALAKDNEFLVDDLFHIDHMDNDQRAIFSHVVSQALQKSYVVLSLVSKSALGWIIVLGTMGV